MKTLFLLRHAKASKEDPGLPDIKRPLTERGFSDGRLVSEVLRQQDLVPEKIISSSAVRAYTTAYLFAATFEKLTSDIELNGSLYEGEPEDYLDVIHGIDNSFSSCMIAGHNNTITDVAAQLLHVNLESMKTCGVVVITSEAERWEDFNKSNCTLKLNLYPSLIA